MRSFTLHPELGIEYINTAGEDDGLGTATCLARLASGELSNVKRSYSGCQTCLLHNYADIAICYTVLGLAG